MCSLSFNGGPFEQHAYGEASAKRASSRISGSHLVFATLGNLGLEFSKFEIQLLPERTNFNKRNRLAKLHSV